MMRKAELIEKVRQAGREYELWKPDDKILVAVSGGRIISPFLRCIPESPVIPLPLIKRKSNVST